MSTTDTNRIITNLTTTVNTSNDTHDSDSHPRLHDSHHDVNESTSPSTPASAATLFSHSHLLTTTTGTTSPSHSDLPSSPFGSQLTRNSDSRPLTTSTRTHGLGLENLNSLSKSNSTSTSSTPTAILTPNSEHPHHEASLLPKNIKDDNHDGGIKSKPRSASQLESGGDSNSGDHDHDHDDDKDKSQTQLQSQCPSQLRSQPQCQWSDLSPDAREGILDRLDEDWEHDPDNPRNWSLWTKWRMAAIVSFYTFVSPVSSSMMAPALPNIGTHFDIRSTALLDMTLSIFLLAYALGPLVLGPLSEVYGRKWVLHISNISFLIFNLACAFAPNTAVLIVFRFLAGLGGSAPVSIGGGVIGDLFSETDRASAMAIFTLGPLLGPSVGPVAGGFIAGSQIGFKWIFIVIAISAAVAAVLGIPFLRETYAPIIRLRRASRGLQDVDMGVGADSGSGSGSGSGMGEVESGRRGGGYVGGCGCGEKCAGVSMGVGRDEEKDEKRRSGESTPEKDDEKNTSKSNSQDDYQNQNQNPISTIPPHIEHDLLLTRRGPPKEVLWLSLTRPFALLFKSFICFILSFYMGLSYGYYYLMFATFPDVFGNIYGFSPGLSGLAYLGPGIGFALSTAYGAYVADAIYHNLSAKNGGKGKPEFRIPALIFASCLVPVGLFWYGWSVQAGAHWIVPILGAGVFAFGMMNTFLPIQLYLVDSFRYAASAIAAATVLRSFLGFIFPLFGEQMFRALGNGGGYSLLAGVSIVVGIPFPIWIYYKGESIRARSNLNR